MNFKNFLLPLTLALFTMWAIQYWFFYKNSNQSGDGEVKSGQTFIAPQSKFEAQPLKRDIEFGNGYDRNQKPATTVVENEHAIYTFSTDGACLEQLVFKRSAHEGSVITISTLGQQQRSAGHEYCSFLVALDQKTPLRYELVEKRRLASSTELVYRSITEQVLIEKMFSVYDATFQIDLKIRIIPQNNQQIQARLFFDAPLLQEGDRVHDDVIAGVYNNQKGSIEKVTVANIDLNKGWFLPSFFGSEDRYFVHALIADKQSFAQRAYYAIMGHQGLVSILESAPFTASREWNLSFYMGPKEDQTMQVVDRRLEQTLEHSGILAPLSRFLLVVLKYLYGFVHNYGWAIVLMTLLINLILLPLNIKSAKSMKKSAEFQKKLTYIQHRYKDDPDTLNRERQELMNKNGMSMLGGCLPKLMQLPIFFALSRVLSSSIELYRAPFIGWIHDLSSPDPYYVLPTLIGALMIFQPTAMVDPRQRFTMIAVALVFGAFALKFSAGLCLYILVGIVLNSLQVLLQQKLNWM